MPVSQSGHADATSSQVAMEEHRETGVILPSEIQAAVTSLVASLTQVAPESPQGRESWLRRKERDATIRLLALRIALNDSLPISRIPEEILVSIFAWAARSWSPAHCWFRVTHVCRRWRDVALRSSVLWATISLHNKDFISAFIERSRGVPLDISWHTERRDEDVSRLHDTICQPTLSSRIQGLDLLLSNKAYMLLSTKFDTWSCPNLRTLRLSRLPPSDGVAMRTYMSNLNLTNHLHTLILQDIELSPSSSLFSCHLRILRISSVIPLDHRRLLSTLQDCTSLEELHLHRAGPILSSQDKDTESLPNIELPLKLLSVWQLQDHESMSQFLSHAHCLARAQVAVDFDCSLFYGRPQHRSTILSYIMECLQGAIPHFMAARLIARVSFGYSNQDDLVKVSGWCASTEEEQKTVTAQEPSWKITFHSVRIMENHPNGYGIPILTCLGKLLTATHLREFYLSYELSVFWDKHWEPFFRLLPHLELLNITWTPWVYRGEPWPKQSWNRPNDAGFEIVLALTPILAEPTLPLLRRLELNNFNACIDADKAPFPNSVFTTDLARCLDDREKQGVAEDFSVWFDGVEVEFE